MRRLPVDEIVSQIFSTRWETLIRRPAYWSSSGMKGIASSEASASSVARISSGDRSSTTSPGRRARSLDGLAAATGFLPRISTDVAKLAAAHGVGPALKSSAPDAQLVGSEGAPAEHVGTVAEVQRECVGHALVHPLG